MWQSAQRLCSAMGLAATQLLRAVCSSISTVLIASAHLPHSVYCPIASHSRTYDGTHAAGVSR
jgi:hypothetical protein